MSETPTPHKKEDSKEPNYFMRRAAAATGLAVTLGATGYGVGKAIEAGVQHFEKEPVAETVVTLKPGQNVIGLIEEWVPSLALEAGVDPSAIPYNLIVEEGQEAAKEMFILTNETARDAGEQYKIEITKNDANQYGLEVSPYEQPLIDSGLPPLDQDPVN